LDFRYVFRRDCQTILVDFGKICEVFGETVVKRFIACQVEELALRIKATRGRSSRPNPLKDQGDSSKALRPAAFRRLPRGFHSVAKQASSGIALRSDFRGFRSDFRRFRKPKWMPKSTLGTFFFDVFFEGGSTLILGCF